MRLGVILSNRFNAKLIKQIIDTSQNTVWRIYEIRKHSMGHQHVRHLFIPLMFVSFYKLFGENNICDHMVLHLQYADRLHVVPELLWHGFIISFQICTSLYDIIISSHGLLGSYSPHWDWYRSYWENRYSVVTEWRHYNAINYWIHWFFILTIPVAYIYGTHHWSPVYI